MKYLRKLPNSRREPPGLEWVVLRKLPITLLGGTVIPVLFAIAGHFFPPAGTPVEVAKHLTMVNIFSIATVVTVWASAFTLAIGCCVVVLMKGPAYVADKYELQDADRP